MHEAGFFSPEIVPYNKFVIYRARLGIEQAAFI